MYIVVKELLKVTYTSSNYALVIITIDVCIVVNPLVFNLPIHTYVYRCFTMHNSSPQLCNEMTEIRCQYVTLCFIDVYHTYVATYNIILCDIV